MKKIRRYYRKTKKKAHKKAKFALRHPLVLPMSVFIVTVFFGLGLFVMLGATTEGAQDKRIVDIYVDEEQRTVSTRAKTVGDLLDRLEINYIEEDIIEPSLETPILEDNVQINIYRARPVKVIDGDRTVTVLSAEQIPFVLVEKAGINVLPEDDLRLVNNQNETTDIGLGERLIIDRSVPIQLTVYGVIKKSRTTADTVGELLNENGIVIAEGENLQPEDPNTPITPGMLIAVNRPGIKTATVTETIPFDTETLTDSNLETGNRQVRQEGVNGEQVVIYEITEENGIELSRVALQTVVTKAPTNQIIVRGTKLASLNPNLSVSEDKASLMAAAGIAESDYVYVDFIVQKESRWRPGVANAYSGAYGLCQALPASKMASAGADYLSNPVTQLRWCSGYASGRYGSWQGAYNAWLAQGWW